MGGKQAGQRSMGQGSRLKLSPQCISAWGACLPHASVSVSSGTSRRPGAAGMQVSKAQDDACEAKMAKLRGAAAEFAVLVEPAQHERKKPRNQLDLFLAPPGVAGAAALAAPPRLAETEDEDSDEEADTSEVEDD